MRDRTAAWWTGYRMRMPGAGYVFPRNRNTSRGLALAYKNNRSQKNNSAGRNGCSALKKTFARFTTGHFPKSTARFPSCPGGEFKGRDRKVSGSKFARYAHRSAQRSLHAAQPRKLFKVLTSFPGDLPKNTPLSPSFSCQTLFLKLRQSLQDLILVHIHFRRDFGRSP